MQLVLSILSAGVIVSSLVTNKPEFKQGVDGTIDGTSNKSRISQLTNDNRENPERRIVTEEDGGDLVEDVDFDGDEFDDEYSTGLPGAGSVDSLMHIHHEEGEILVPCFGMWWPVGGYYGGGGGYEYVDYYGDYRKKKRRSRKQKKAAKMKKKKS